VGVTTITALLALSGKNRGVVLTALGDMYFVGPPGMEVREQTKFGKEGKTYQ
jgi:hypothetical protein